MCDKIDGSEEFVHSEVASLSVVISITAGCGGQGCSAFASLLTRALASLGRTVALVDAKGGAGALDSMTGTKSTSVFNLGDVITGRCELSDAVCEPFDGAVFLPAAKWSDDAPLFSLGSVLVRFESCDYIIIDMPRAQSESANKLLSCSDIVILCCKPSRYELRHTAVIRRRLQKIGADTRLVLNMVESESMEVPDLDFCIDEAGTRLIGVLPLDRTLSASFAKGECIAKGDAFDAVLRIARRIEGEKTEIPKM